MIVVAIGRVPLAAMLQLLAVPCAAPAEDLVFQGDRLPELETPRYAPADRDRSSSSSAIWDPKRAPSRRRRR